MRKTSIAGIALTCGAIITLGWQLGTQGVPSTTSDSPLAAAQSLPVATESPNPTTPASVAAKASESPTAVSASKSSPAPSSFSPVTTSTKETVTGDSVDTRYGSVQVSATFNGSTITDVTAVKLTDEDRKSVQISQRAAPLLKASVLKSQSAKVSTISGATYTSEAYLESLQSAIDKHHA